MFPKPGLEGSSDVTNCTMDGLTNNSYQVSVEVLGAICPNYAPLILLHGTTPLALEGVSRELTPSEIGVFNVAWEDLATSVMFVGLSQER